MYERRNSVLYFQDWALMDLQALSSGSPKCPFDALCGRSVMCDLRRLIQPKKVCKPKRSLQPRKYEASRKLRLVRPEREDLTDTA
jgi:hypothetical protein